MSGVEKLTPLRPLVADLNPALMCRLCGGYYVDAAAIIECLHAFCKSCLVRYLETNKYCPICDVQVHKSRPLQNIRLDPTLQEMVYKLVPGLYQKEMKSRREFYCSRPDAPPSSLEDRGETPSELCPFYTPDEPVSLVLEYTPQVESDSHTNIKDPQSKRFLRCPAAVKITHLEKLLRNKYGLDNRYNIDLMLEDSKLSPDLTLMDVAYAFGRKRKGQFLFTYRIYDSHCKKMRLADCDMDTLPPPEIKAEVKNELDTPLSSAAPSAPTTLTTTCVSMPFPTPTSTPTPTTMTTTTAPSAPSAPSAPALVTTVPSVTLATLSTPCVTTAIPSTLTIPAIPAVPTVTSAPTTSSVSVSANTYVTTSAPSLKVTVQRLNPTTVKSASPAPAAPAALAKLEKSLPASSADKSNKLNSIISRLGDPSKHPRPEAPKKPQGKEVQLRISENGEMITNVVQNDKAQAPQAATGTQLRPGTPQPNSSTLQPKPAHPQPNPAASQPKPVAPQPKSSTPQSKPGTPLSKQASPQPNAATLHPKAATPQPNPAAPQPKAATPQLKPATPQVKPAAPAVKPTPKVSNTSSGNTAMQAGAVTPVSPSGATSPRKHGSSPVGYKTLKSGPKSWNPTISRNSYLSAKLELQQQVQKAQLQNKDGSPGGAKSPAPAPEPPKPLRIFKGRNTPRYLGNPASGVKPMYQVASPPPSIQKAAPKAVPKPPPAVLKINPKTLTPILTSSPPPPTKDRPPFLSTTISGSNHVPSSRGVTTTSTTVTENLSKTTSSDLGMRSAPTPAPPTPPTPSTPHPYMRLFSYCDQVNPFGPGLGDPARIPTSPPYSSLLRAPFSPLLANSYGLSRPPVGVLYNQSLHRQVNHTGPLSPVPGLPSPLPPSSAPLSPSSTLKNIIPPVPWASPQASPQASPSSKMPLSAQPSKKPSTEVQPKVTEKQTKVNGEKSLTQPKDKSAPLKPVEKETDKKEGDTKAVRIKENTKEHKGSEQDNNNTVVIQKKPESGEDARSLSHNISKLCSPAVGAAAAEAEAADRPTAVKEPPAAKADRPTSEQVAVKQT